MRLRPGGLGSRPAAEAALFFNTLVWGATFVLVKAALGHISPVLFLALRFSLATLVLLPLLLRRPRLEARAAAAGALCGIFLLAGFLFQTLGLRLTTAPKSAFVTGLTSVMVPFVAALVYRIRPQASELAGILIATGGLALLTLNRPAGAVNPGDLLTVLGAVAFSAHIVTLGHFSERMSFEVLSITQVGAAALGAVILSWRAGPPRVDWRPEVVWAVLITGILATGLAFTIQAWAMQYTTASRTALIFMFEPVAAWATSFWLTGEGLSARGAAGAALILLGILMVELKPLRQRQHPSN